MVRLGLMPSFAEITEPVYDIQPWIPEYLMLCVNHAGLVRRTHMAAAQEMRRER